MKRRLFAQAAKPMTDKTPIAGFVMTEKLDGMNAFWDGGCTTGMLVKDVPWSGYLNPKTGEPKKALIGAVSSGLWSRYGNPINAPKSFTDKLPKIVIAGELWSGRGNFQKVVSTVRKKVPIEAEWSNIEFVPFAIPNFRLFLEANTEIKNPNHHARITSLDVSNFLSDNRGMITTFSETYMHELKIIEKYCGHSMDYTFLPDDEQEARKLVHKVMLAVVERGGEGVYLRDPSSPWTPMRTNSCIKVKGCLDAEGTLVEFMPGLGKYLGVIGSLRLKWNGKSIQVSGLTDEERGDNTPFKIGDTITFKFREFTDEGFPKEPRFDRVRYRKGDLQ